MQAKEMILSMFRTLMISLTLASQAHADPVQMIADAAQASFDQMPHVARVAVIAGNCGADATVDPRVAYCTTTNTVLVADTANSLPETPYLVAHAYGHAVQVRHGVADFALAQIRNRRSEETALRRLVELQVDCIAGFLTAQAAVPPVPLTDLFAQDPLNQPHWGRNPLRLGPFVDLAVDDRAMWYETGLKGDIAACAPGEFSADLLVAARR